MQAHGEHPRILRLEPYATQVARWPKEGRRLLAQFDEHTIILYQAYQPATAHSAASSGHLGGVGFSFNRMSWVKPNFLWMMHRSGWASKPSQEHVLALRVRRTAFDALLERAVLSSFESQFYSDKDVWRRALRASDVLFQWDPDHTPTGAPLPRRALQLGLRGAALRAFALQSIIEIEDVTTFVIMQRDRLSDEAALLTPSERPYPLCLAIERRLHI